jgi:hypothetical protein
VYYGYTQSSNSSFAFGLAVIMFGSKAALQQYTHTRSNRKNFFNANQIAYQEEFEREEEYKRLRLVAKHVPRERMQIRRNTMLAMRDACATAIKSINQLPGLLQGFNAQNPHLQLHDVLHDRVYANGALPNFTSIARMADHVDDNFSYLGPGGFSTLKLHYSELPQRMHHACETIVTQMKYMQHQEESLKNDLQGHYFYSVLPKQAQAHQPEEIPGYDDALDTLVLVQETLKEELAFMDDYVSTHPPLTKSSPVDKITARLAALGWGANTTSRS